MDEKKTKSPAKEKYVPPKILATYSKEEVEGLFRRSRLHAGPLNDSGCGCGSNVGT